MIRVYRPASDESLVIVLHEVAYEDSRRALADDAVLERDGAERQIPVLLERAPETIEPGLTVLERERFTDVGPVDLFCRDAEGRTVVVEVKRVRASPRMSSSSPATASASISIRHMRPVGASWWRRRSRLRPGSCATRAATASSRSTTRC